LQVVHIARQPSQEDGFAAFVVVAVQRIRVRERIHESAIERIHERAIIVVVIVVVA
jgi:hypothetical protein